MSAYQLEWSGQGRNEGGRGGTIPQAPNHCGGEWLRAVLKSPAMSQALSSMQYICFRKISGSNTGAPNLLLVPGGI